MGSFFLNYGCELPPELWENKTNFVERWIDAVDNPILLVDATGTRGELKYSVEKRFQGFPSPIYSPPDLLGSQLGNISLTINSQTGTS